MIYVALFREKSEGCDHMIGCGMLYTVLQSNDIDDAKREMNGLYNDMGGEEHEGGWNEIILIECSKYISKIIPPRKWTDE